MEFFDALVRYQGALRGAVDQELRRHSQIALAQLYAVRVLHRYAGRARVQDLSRELGTTVGGVSKLVDRLVSLGLATRSPNPSNRRSCLIGLTEGGREALVSATDVCRRRVAEAVGEDDVADLVVALERLHSRLRTSVVGAAP